MNLSPSEKLIRAVFGEPVKTFVDYPMLYADDNGVIAEALGNLSPRERRVLELRFGLNDGESKTLKAVGKEFNATPERIRQIEAKALRKLRHPSRSRKFKELLYKPTRDDFRAVAMRRRLCNELLRFYPASLAYDITMGVKRPYLKRALRDLSLGNIGKQLRLSCELGLRFCKNCGTVTLPNWDFCSRECQLDYRNIDLVCDWCGVTFKRKAGLTVYLLQKFKHYYCSRHCAGKALGNRPRKGGNPMSKTNQEDLLLSDELVQGYCDRLVSEDIIILNDELKEILRDFLRLARPEIEREERERIFKEIDDASAVEKLPFRDGGAEIRTIPDSKYQVLKGG